MSSFAASSTSGRFAHAGVLALTVAVFGAVVAVVTLQLRTGLRDQILQGEAEKMAAIAAMQLDNSAADLGDVPLSDVSGILLVQVLKISKLRGVLGVRVFDLNQKISSHYGVLDLSSPARSEDWSRVTAGQAFARIHPTLPIEDFFISRPAGSSTVVETWVPLRTSATKGPIGAAQVWLDGGSAGMELGTHDRRLWVQAVIAWIAGSVVIVLVLEWGFRRLAAANRELRARSDDLQKANRELVLAAKTSALGAVTAHLMHELKNPLAGLELIVAGHGESGSRGEAGGELAEASALTKRLRTMVNDVVGVLRDEQTGAVFVLSVPEIVEVLVTKMKPEAAARRITIDTLATGSASLAGRRANLAMLVLRNLLQNALEASVPESGVSLQGESDVDGTIEFRVEDRGPGLAPSVRDRLFQPCASSKVGGSGLGLALSYQLAQHAGGKLELVRSDATGTCFRLVLAPEA